MPTVSKTFARTKVDNLVGQWKLLHRNGKKEETIIQILPPTLITAEKYPNGQIVIDGRSTKIERWFNDYTFVVSDVPDAAYKQAVFSLTSTLRTLYEVRVGPDNKGQSRGVWKKNEDASNEIKAKYIGGLLTKSKTERLSKGHWAFDDERVDVYPPGSLGRGGGGGTVARDLYSKYKISYWLNAFSFEFYAHEPRYEFNAVRCFVDAEGDGSLHEISYKQYRILKSQTDEPAKVKEVLIETFSRNKLTNLVGNWYRNKYKRGGFDTAIAMQIIPPTVEDAQTYPNGHIIVDDRTTKISQWLNDYTFIVHDHKARQKAQEEPDADGNDLVTYKQVVFTLRAMESFYAERLFETRIDADDKCEGNIMWARSWRDWRRKEEEKEEIDEKYQDGLDAVPETSQFSKGVWTYNDERVEVTQGGKQYGLPGGICVYEAKKQQRMQWYNPFCFKVLRDYSEQSIVRFFIDVDGDGSLHEISNNHCRIWQVGEVVIPTFSMVSAFSNNKVRNLVGHYDLHDTDQDLQIIPPTVGTSATYPNGHIVVDGRITKIAQWFNDYTFMVYDHITYVKPGEDRDADDNFLLEYKQAVFTWSPFDERLHEFRVWPDGTFQDKIVWEKHDDESVQIKEKYQVHGGTDSSDFAEFSEGIWTYNDELVAVKPDGSNQQSGTVAFIRSLEETTQSIAFWPNPFSFSTLKDGKSKFFFVDADGDGSLHEMDNHLYRDWRAKNVWIEGHNVADVDDHEAPLHRIDKYAYQSLWETQDYTAVRDWQDWEHVDLSSTIPKSLSNMYEVADWIRQNYPDAVGFTALPLFDRGITYGVHCVTKEGKQLRSKKTAGVPYHKYLYPDFRILSKNFSVNKLNLVKKWGRLASMSPQQTYKNFNTPMTMWILPPTTDSDDEFPNGRIVVHDVGPRRVTKIAKWFSDYAFVVYNWDARMKPDEEPDAEGNDLVTYKQAVFKLSGFTEVVWHGRLDEIRCGFDGKHSDTLQWFENRVDRWKYQEKFDRASTESREFSAGSWASGDNRLELRSNRDVIINGTRQKSWFSNPYSFFVDSSDSGNGLVRFFHDVDGDGSLYEIANNVNRNWKPTK